MWSVFSTSIYIILRFSRVMTMLFNWSNHKHKEQTHYHGTIKLHLIVSIIILAVEETNFYGSLFCYFVLNSIYLSHSHLYKIQMQFGICVECFCSTAYDCVLYRCLLILEEFGFEGPRVKHHKTTTIHSNGNCRWCNLASTTHNFYYITDQNFSSQHKWERWEIPCVFYPHEAIARRIKWTTPHIAWRKCRYICWCFAHTFYWNAVPWRDKHKKDGILFILSVVFGKMMASLHKNDLYYWCFFFNFGHCDKFDWFYVLCHPKTRE